MYFQYQRGSIRSLRRFVCITCFCVMLICAAAANNTQEHLVKDPNYHSVFMYESGECHHQHVVSAAGKIELARETMIMSSPPGTTLSCATEFHALLKDDDYKAAAGRMTGEEAGVAASCAHHPRPDVGNPAAAAAPDDSDINIKLDTQLLEFTGVLEHANLDIYLGHVNTSEYRLLKRLSKHEGEVDTSFIIPSSRFTLIFHSRSIDESSRGFHLVYTIYHRECSSDDLLDDTVYECGNGRCLAAPLHCDTYNNCGDTSDEQGCYGEDREDEWFRHPVVIISAAVAGGLLLLLSVTCSLLAYRSTRKRAAGGHVSTPSLTAAVGSQFRHQRMREEEEEDGATTSQVPLPAPATAIGSSAADEQFRVFHFSMDMSAESDPIPNAFENPGYLQQELDRFSSDIVVTTAEIAHHPNGSEDRTDIIDDCNDTDKENSEDDVSATTDTESKTNVQKFL